LFKITNQKYYTTPKIYYRGVIRRGEYGYFLRFQIRQRFNNLILNYNSSNWSEEQQETHDLIKSLHDCGLGYRKIAQHLNEKGIKTVRGNTLEKYPSVLCSQEIS